MHERMRQLQEELLPLQGYRPPTAGARVDMGLGPVTAAFPKGEFPTGAVHELLSATAEDRAATGGFVAALLGPLMGNGGICLWIGMRRTVFPPALRRFGLDPEKVVFVDLQREKDAIWAMEEALKCEGVTAVVGEIRELDFTASRKLQLAVEKSRVTGFLLRHQPRGLRVAARGLGKDGQGLGNGGQGLGVGRHGLGAEARGLGNGGQGLGTVAAVARWKVSALSSEPVDGMPGLGFPRWKVELLKVRNGRPGQWIVEWKNGIGFKIIDHEQTICLPVLPASENGLAGYPQAGAAG